MLTPPGGRAAVFSGVPKATGRGLAGQPRKELDVAHPPAPALRFGVSPAELWDNPNLRHPSPRGEGTRGQTPRGEMGDVAMRGPSAPQGSKSPRRSALDPLVS